MYLISSYPIYSYLTVPPALPPPLPPVHSVPNVIKKTDIPKIIIKATTAVFHSAMTAFGDQHSVVIGTAGGSVVKCNADAWEPPQLSTQPAASSPPGEGGAGRSGGGGDSSGAWRLGGEIKHTTYIYIYMCFFSYADGRLLSHVCTALSVNIRTIYTGYY